MKKKLIVIISATIIVTVISLTFFRNKTFRYSGTLEANEISVSSRLTDILAEINADEGDKVKKGDLLALLECKETALKHSLAKKEFERASQLLKGRAGSQENYDIRKNVFMQAEIQKSYCELRSPADGQILYRFFEPGELIAAGQRLITLADLSKMEAWFYVPYEKLADLSIGQHIEGYLPENGKKYTGRIAKINEEAEFTPKNVQTRDERTRLVFGIKAVFENDGRQALKPGMTIETDFSETATGDLQNNMQ